MKHSGLKKDGNPLNTVNTVIDGSKTVKDPQKTVGGVQGVTGGI